MKIYIQGILNWTLFLFFTQIHTIPTPLATLLRTRPGFAITQQLTRYYTGSDFTFDQITGKNARTSAKIGLFDDGKTTPLCLGSIPYEQRHIDQLHIFCKNLSSDKKVGLHTLNEPWECDVSGLSDLVKNNSSIITQFHYPTRDYSTPSMKHIVQAVYNLENRDADHTLALVHCKAGRGRSATIVAAYLMTQFHKNNNLDKSSIKEIEDYLRYRRPIVKLDSSQKNALTKFYEELTRTDNFENLYQKYHTK
jgi:hypothetical protein